MIVHRMLLPMHAAEATGVGQSHGAPIVEFEIHMVVLAGRRACGNDREVS